MSMVVDVQNIEAGKLKNPSVYAAGSLMLRKMLVPQPLFVRPNGTPLFTLKEHMGLEACLMPYMFPYGLGSYVDSDKKFSYAEYLRFRMKTLLSPWTLVKPYLLFSYQIRQAAVTAKACPPQLLSKAIVDFKKENPEASEQEISLDWKDAPVECAVLFNERVKLFMEKYITNNKGILGRVTHHVIRYEVHNRGSLHAHIILWVDPKDIERIASEICGMVPAEVDPSNSSSFIEPECPEQARLLHMILRKNMHTCGQVGDSGCREKGKCKYGFPLPQQHNRTPVYDVPTKRYLYFRPREEDRNVVPYHPTVMAIWGAHSNLQVITNETWSYYVLKYAMKTEPLGKLNLDVNTAKNLGFTDLDDEQLKIISAMQLSKPVSPCEAACACLGIDMIRKSDTVTFMETSPMAIRTTTLMFCTTTSTPPVDKYCARPDSLEHCKLKEYFEQHDLLREDTEPPKGSTLVGTDIFGNMVYRLKTPRLIRVSDFHPAHQPQGFFYNLLISKLAFRDESHLLAQGNTDYMTECVLREFIKDEEDLHRIMEDFCDYHLYQDSDRGMLLEGLLQQYNTCDLTSPDDIPSAEAFTALGTSPESMAPHLLDEFACLRDFRLNIEQQKVYDILLPKKNGLSVISGMGGTGKSLLIAKLTHELRAQGKKVVLAATTGAAATRLSQYGVTAHHLFALPIRGQSLRPMSATHPARTILDDGDVFVIDEHSMLTAMDLNYIAYRLMQSSANYNTHLQHFTGDDTPNTRTQDPFAHKHIILVGDLQQLPPVCNCKKDDNDQQSCIPCHITRSVHWARGTMHNLTLSVRHAKDPRYSKFLELVREKVPLLEQIKEVLTADMYIPADQVVYTACEDTTILCSHHEEVQEYNMGLLNKWFPTINPEDLQTVQPHITPETEDEDLLTWASDPTFHSMDEVGIGMRVLIYTPPPQPTSVFEQQLPALRQPYQLGDQGIVTALSREAAVGCSTIIITSISVKLLKDNTMYTFTRTIQSTRRSEGHTYTRSTFPLRLCKRTTVHMKHNCGKNDGLERFLEEKHFHHLKEVSIGAKVMLTNNINLKKGAANGSTGIVLDIASDAEKNVRNFTVLLHKSNKVIKVYRTTFRTVYAQGCRFFKSSFPLMLAYAMNGHKSQGATLSGPTIVHMKEAFTPGLLYVMLSRVTERAHLCIVGQALIPEVFNPMSMPSRNQ
eukprot:gene3121-biopygen20880